MVGRSYLSIKKSVAILGRYLCSYCLNMYTCLCAPSIWKWNWIRKCFMKLIPQVVAIKGIFYRWTSRGRCSPHSPSNCSFLKPSWIMTNISTNVSWGLLKNLFLISFFFFFSSHVLSLRFPTFILFFFAATYSFFLFPSLYFFLYFFGAMYSLFRSSFKDRFIHFYFRFEDFCVDCIRDWGLQSVNWHSCDVVSYKTR